MCCAMTFFSFSPVWQYKNFIKLIFKELFLVELSVHTKARTGHKSCIILPLGPKMIFNNVQCSAKTAEESKHNVQSDIQLTIYLWTENYTTDSDQTKNYKCSWIPSQNKYPTKSYLPQKIIRQVTDYQVMWPKTCDMLYIHCKSPDRQGNH